MSSIYRRTKLATEMTQRLLQPGVLDEGLRSGLFLSGLRRIGKTTFLINDLIPALEEAGAVVIYVDLWSDVQVSPSDLVRRAIRSTLTALQAPASTVFKKLKGITAAEIAAYGFKFSFALEKLGDKDGTTLAKALTEVVDQAATDLVLIVDEVQHALATDDGTRVMLALKAARDAINSRPDTPGHFLFIGTGSHRALIGELVTRRNQAFAGATSVPYPVLNGDFVEYVFQRLAQEAVQKLPSIEAAKKAFDFLGNRPEELMKAIRLLRSQLPYGVDPDVHLAVIVATLRTAAADAELLRLERLGGLANAVFERIAGSNDGARGLFSSDAAADYSRMVGHEVRVDEIQPVVNELLAANLIMRRAHGVYVVTDPFVQDTWLEEKRLTQVP
ncbi:MAG TPA: AAA family ATPase [Steroidobacteraceae bacterium]|nr:AAA family ATPase [Steroidobacteraceae bacterium]